MGHKESAEDSVSNRIDKVLQDLPTIPSERCIFKVHNVLRKVNEAAFDPEIIAIGPYHRGKDYLQLMEEQKLHYLQQLLKRRNESSVERYVVVLRALEERARKCYAEPISLSKDEFVEMMLLDGCFIIEYFRKSVKMQLRDKDDIIFNFSRKYQPSLRRDLLLFENQLPFFVLLELFREIDKEKDFIPIAVVGLTFNLIQIDGYVPDFHPSSPDQIKHLLDLIHASFVPASVETIPDADATVKRKNWPFMRCAAELKEAAVKFKKVTEGGFLNIKFNNGVMEIPSLLVHDSTESLFRNLIAHEQYCVNLENLYMTDYLMFMDRLITSAKDVELLRREEIINNLLGDDKEVSIMFNKLCKNVTIGKGRYSTICEDVNLHCGKRWNVWKAKLKQDYLNSPWAIISVLVAFFLLLLAVVQSNFSILKYIKKP